MSPAASHAVWRAERRDHRARTGCRRTATSGPCTRSADVVKSCSRTLSMRRYFAVIPAAGPALICRSPDFAARLSGRGGFQTRPGGAARHPGRPICSSNNAARLACSPHEPLFEYKGREEYLAGMTKLLDEALDAVRQLPVRAKTKLRSPSSPWPARAIPRRLTRRTFPT